MNRIGLKINGIWCVLPQDVSISIEEQNPLFSDSGSFSYPIEMSVSQNRELFKSIDAVAGRTRPHHLDGLPFELWYDGVMLLYGSIETDEDLDIEEDRCTVNLVSGNGDFQSKIEGLQCTDVPLMSEIKIGHYYPEATFFGGEKDDKTNQRNYTVSWNDSACMDFSGCNVSEAFNPKAPAAHPYCNIRVCVKKKEEWGNDWEKVYYILEADRPWSGMCFYVAYFFRCLFAHLGLTVKEDHMCDVEDMKRLAFVSTKCEYRLGPEQKISSGKQLKTGRFVDLQLEGTDFTFIQNVQFSKYEVFATEKNFPDTDVASLVESMFNAFGLKIVSDREGNISIYYLRDILRDNEIVDSPMTVKNLQVSYSKVRGVRMTYGGNEDDTSFNYKDYSGVISVSSDYRTFITNISAYDKKLYISSKTGNKYRVKIDGEAEKDGDEKKLNPALFEVAQFNDYVVGEDCEDAVELKIGFTPLIENDVAFGLQKAFTKERTQCLALYVDGAEINKPGTVTTQIDKGKHGKRTWTLKQKEYRCLNFESDDENPVLSHDCGFMLGVMRGPGSKAGYAIEIEDYDGNGNSAWVTVEDDYAFTSDSIDAYGNHYDYNGTAGGGVEVEGRMSLKTHIATGKDLGFTDNEGNDAWGIDGTAAKRGLADRFMPEYMYFLLNRKPVKMDVDTTLSHLTSLTWFKRHRIGEVVGFLKSRSYTLTNSGVMDKKIEMYIVN